MLRDLLKRAGSSTPQGRRALPRRRPERRRGGQRRALLPGHVLRLAGVLEPARPAHVRDAAACCVPPGPDVKAVVWEHNSHVGDAAATEMGARGELNVGQLCPGRVRRRRVPDRLRHRPRRRSRRRTTGTGRCSTWPCAPPTPTATSGCATRPACRRSCCICGSRRGPRCASELAAPRLERAIGVIYRPETELQSHYFQASLPHQFDEYIWFDETSAVTPLAAHHLAGVPDTYPFGL